MPGNAIGSGATDGKRGRDGVSGGVLKAQGVRLAGEVWVDTLAPHEAERAQREQGREARSLTVFHRRIEGLKHENERLIREMRELRAAQEERLETARAEGHSTGLAQGHRQAEEELEEAFRLMELQDREFRRAAAAYHASADKELIRLARWMAEVVLRRALPLDSEALARRVRDVLESCLDQQVLRVHLHSGEKRQLLGPDLAERQPRLDALVRELAGRLEWVESTDVPPGACRVELHDGLLDAAPAAMLRHLEEELVRAVDEGVRP